MKTLILSTLFLYSLNLLSQNPPILWQKTIGGNFDDELTRIIDITGGGYFFIGSSSSNISGDKSENSRGFDDIWIVKTDVNYNIIWDKTIGGDNVDRMYDALIINDVIFIITKSNSNLSGEKAMNSFGGSDLWLIACDLNGTILWQEQYGGTDLEDLGKLMELENGNILVSCLSRSGISGNKTESALGGSDIWLLEINPLNGNILQQKTIGSLNSESYAKCILTSQGTIVIKGGAKEGISGHKTDMGYGEEDIWIVEIDQNFNVLRDKCFGGDYIEIGQNGNILMDGDNYYILGASSSEPSGNKTAVHFGAFGNMDYWVIKTDLDFNILWDKSYGGADDEYPNRIFKNEWNKLVISGGSYSMPGFGNKTSPLYGSLDFWLLILNEDGNIVAQETYGGNGFDAGIAQNQVNSSSNLFLSSYSESGISGNKALPSKGGADCWFMELDASAFLNSNEIMGSDTKLSVYPNPFIDYANFRFTELSENITIRFYSLSGVLLDEHFISNGTQNFVWGNQFNNELVFYEIIGANINYRGKLVRI